MGKFNNHMIMESVSTYFKSVDRNKYTQFTIDFIEEWAYLDEEETKDKDSILAMSYVVDSILLIINPTLEDAQFFKDLKVVLGG